MTLKITRSDIESVVNEIKSSNESAEGYRPMEPAIVSDGPGGYYGNLTTGSLLHDWEHYFSLEAAEAWLYDGDRWPDGREIAENITPGELHVFLGCEADKVELIDDEPDVKIYSSDSEIFAEKAGRIFLLNPETGRDFEELDALPPDAIPVGAEVALDVEIPDLP